MRRYGWTWPSIRDPNRTLARRLGATYQPAFFLIDARGRLVGGFQDAGTAARWNALVAQLRTDGKAAYADAVEEVAELAHKGHITYLDQHGPYGNGTPVLNAARNIGDEPVLVLWPDDVFVAEVPRAQQLIRAYEQTGCPVLALMPMDPADSRRYGVPIVKEDLGEGLLRITGLVEKPKPADAPSSYAAIGGYVVTPGIIDELREQTRRWYEHRQGEIYLTDAINAYAATRAVYGQVIQGRWYDTGNPADYLVAQMASALAHPEYGPILRRLVHDLDVPVDSGEDTTAV